MISKNFALEKWKRQPLATWLAFVALVAFVFLAYSDVYSHQFLYDDEFLLQKNVLIRSWSNLLEIFYSSSTGGSGGVDSFYRPLQTLLYMITYQISDNHTGGVYGGLSTEPYHLLNILLHAINACLVFVLGARLRMNRIGSFFAALLWSLHPLHTEAVTYMSATADPLHTMFCLLGIIILLPRFSKSRVALACVCFLLGLLSKESAIVFPALAVVTYFFYGPRRGDVKAYLFSAPLWLVAALYLIARKTFLNFDDSFNFFDHANIYSENIFVRFTTFVATVPSYLSLLFWPTGLHMDHNFPVYTDFTSGAVVLGLIILLAGFLQIVLGRKKRGGTAMSFGFLWFLAAHTPHTGVLIAVNSLFLEHWLYLPTTGLFLGVGQSLSVAIAEKRKLGITALTAASLAAAALALTTFEQNRVWRTPVTFYTNILRFNEKAARVHNNLAMALSKEERWSEAKSHYERAIEISDVYPQSQYNFALLYLSRNDIENSIPHLLRCIEIGPEFYPAYGTLAEIFEKTGRGEQAKPYRDTYHRLYKKYVKE